MSDSILTNALLNYDKIINESYNYNFYLDNKVDILNNNKKALIINNKLTKFNIKNEYDLIGIYDLKNHIWVWGWLVLDTNVKQLWIWDLSRYYVNNKSNNMVNDIIHTSLINSKFILTENLQLEIILSIALYFCKSDLLFVSKMSNNLHYYYTVKMI